MLRAASVFSVFILLSVLSPTYAQVPTGDSRFEVFQTNLPAPLYSAYGYASSQTGVSIDSVDLDGSLVLMPGVAYKLNVFSSAMALTAHVGSEGALADVQCHLDFGGVVPEILSNSHGSAFGCLTEQNVGNQVCFQPDIGRFFDIDPPLAANSFGAMSTLLFGQGRAFGSSEFAVNLVQDSLIISDRVIADASYSLPSSHGLGATSTVILTIYFRVPQDATMTISGVVGSGLLGSSQEFPIMPQSGGQFLGGPSSMWYASALAQGYDFQQSGSAMFTDVLELPTGVVKSMFFNVFSGTQYLGQFAEGARVDFTQLVGAAVPRFRIIGIGPLVRTADAFAVKLAFDLPVADFSMKPLLYRATR